MPTEKRTDPDKDVATKIGEKLIRLFALKVKEGRVETAVGTKTAIGLGRTVKWLIEETERGSTWPFDE